MKRMITCVAVFVFVSMPAMAKDKIIATVDGVAITQSQVKIGRASCRERV